MDQAGVRQLLKDGGAGAHDSVGTTPIGLSSAIVLMDGPQMKTTLWT
jgi:hypothetical protein